MEFLKFMDRVSLSLASRKYREAFYHPRLLKTIRYKFNHCYIDGNKPPLSVFQGRLLKIPHLTLGSNVFIDTNPEQKLDWKTVNTLKEIGLNIKTVTVKSAGSIGFQVLKYTPNVEELFLCNESTTTSISFLITDIPELQKSLKNVRKLKIVQNFEQFEEITDLLPKLTHLVVEGFSCKQQKSFKRNQSLSLTTLGSVIYKYAGQLEEISLHSYTAEADGNDEFLRLILGLDNLRLKTLTLSIDQANFELIIELLIIQRGITSLNLTCWSEFPEQILGVVFMVLLDLEHLTLRGKLSTNSLRYLGNLLRLKSVRFKDTFDSETYYPHILEDLKGLKSNLLELEIDTDCSNSALCDSCFPDFSASCTNILVLNLSKSKVDDLTLAKLLKNLKTLNQLYLNDCKNLSSLTVNEESSIIPNFNSVEKLELNHCISLTSNGLQGLSKFPNLIKLSLNNLEVVNRIVVETIVTQCNSIQELYLSNCHELDNYSVELIATKLKRLQVLDISWCKSLSKLTEYAIWKSKSLQSLYAKGLQRIGMSIILMFANIGTLHLYQCDQDYTRAEFEARKYTTTRAMEAQRKVQSIAMCIMLGHRRGNI